MGLLLVAHQAAATSAIALYGDTPKYEAGFRHFDYADPQRATKGGKLRLHGIGSFDSLNPYILKGVAAAALGGYVDATLMKASLDEPLSHYGYIAEAVEVGEGEIVFTIRNGARFNDGAPITAADVVFSFDTLLGEGHPFYRLYFGDIKEAVALGRQRVKFVLNENAKKDAPFVIGNGLPILPQHYWRGKDFSRPSPQPPLGSGPYEVTEVNPGRNITYKRVENWWGDELAVNRGFYNFDEITYVYFRDETVALAAFKAADYDFRLESQAKAWAEEYDFAAAEQGRVVIEELPHQMVAGMQGFVFNTRREIFKDIRVRQALAMAYDFQWANRVLFHDQYTRTNSYFDNSELAAEGLPNVAELKLLNRYRGQIPTEVFGEPFRLPEAGSGDALRQNLRRARELLAAAGWRTVQGKLLNEQTMRPMRFEILLRNPQFERVTSPFIKNLEKLGVEANIRTVQEDAQYQKRLEEFDFDMAVALYPSSLSPGNELLDIWSSAAATTQGSRNLAGVQDKAVDGLLQEVTSAASRKELITAVRALDRVLQFGHYMVPHWHLGRFRVAWWDKFSRPTVLPIYGITLDTWWLDEAKLKRLTAPTAHRNKSRGEWLTVAAVLLFGLVLRSIWRRVKK